MGSWRTAKFRKLYDKLDPATQALVDAAYESYKRDPKLVNFEQKGRLQGVPHFGARINENWRALAFQTEGETFWYWVGLHTDYDRILKGMGK